MDEYLGLYTEIYKSEIQRSKDLNDAVNAPVTLITFMISLMYFMLGKIDVKLRHAMDIILFCGFLASLIFILVAIIFLARSYNNLFKGFKYYDLPRTSELLDYHKQLIEYNELRKDDPKSFSAYLIDRYTSYSDDSAVKNDRRARDLYISKTFIILAVLIQSLEVIIYLVSVYFKI